MGQIRKPAPVLLFVAVFSSVDGAFHWAKRRLEAEFGAVEMESDTFATEDFTDYYARDMGEKLPKKLWGFSRFDRPGGIVADQGLDQRPRRGVSGPSSQLSRQAGFES